MSRSSGAVRLAIFLLVGGAIAVLFFAAGGGSLYGLGFDLRWRMVDRGHVERHGLTTKSSWFRLYEEPRIVLLPGETIEVDYAFEGESGGATLSVSYRGWVRALTTRETLASTRPFDSPAVRTLRATAARSGFHEIRVHLREAVGVARADWRVVNARPLGRILRLGQLVWFLIPAALMLLVGYALVRRITSAA